MKVLMLTSTLPRFAGDMQANFVREQADAWLAARPADRIAILAPHDPGAPFAEEFGPLDIHRFQYFYPASWQKLAYPAILPNIRANRLLMLQVPPFLVAEYRAAKALVRSREKDLVYAHWVMPQGVVAWLLKRNIGIPYILQNHSSDLSVFDKFGGMGRRLARKVMRDALHFFCVNRAQREFALSFFEGTERDEFAKRCTVLPMGMVLSQNGPAPSDRVHDIATIGRLSRKKGINFLISAGESLATRGVFPRIAIAGDGEDRSLLQSMVRNADVTFAGFLTGADKDRFFLQSKRFAFPAKASDGDVEGLPVSLLEALCRGLPVLASRDTNIEMLPEWPQLRDRTIFIEDPADLAALERSLEALLALEPKKAAETAAIVGRYRWERLIEEYLAPIEAALSGRGAAAV